MVNSYHHQAIKDTGKGIKVIARAANDGTTEGVTLENAEQFVLGVQWHPEMMYDSEDHKKIFRAFVVACAK